MLRQHPSVFAPNLKELHYFDRDDYQYENHDEYSTYFAKAKDYKIRAEFTPRYLFLPEVPQRILELLGAQTKILIILRNPVDRAFSAYQMNLNKGIYVQQLQQIFKENPSDICFARGLYVNQIQRYLDRFDAVKIILFEDFIRNTDEEMIGIYRFLGIENHRIPLFHSNEQRHLKSMTLGRLKVSVVKLLSKYNFLRRNTLLKKINRSLNQLNSKPKQKIDPAFAKVLQDYYHDDICELEKLIGRDLTAWKTKY